MEAKRKAAEVEEEARRCAFRNFATEELNKPASIGRVHKILRKTEGAEQAPPGQALGEHGRRAAEGSGEGRGARQDVRKRQPPGPQ